MALKYYNAYRKGSSSTKPKDSYINDFNAMMEHSFDNAANIFYNEIQFEFNYGSNEFVTIPEVRVDSVTDYNTSMLVNSDEYKIFIFKANFPQPDYGMKFKWGENYWLVINVVDKQNMAVSCEVRRCNNVLRFFDKNGNKIYEPCIMDTTLRFTNNIDTPPITTGKQEQKIWCQRNSRTTTIRPNDKFIFGAPNQRYAIRLYSGGMKNELNTITMDDNSPSLTEFYFQHYQINPEYDDLENGFANAYLNDFKISIDNPLDTLKINQTGQFSATVTKNGEIIESPISWKSTNESLMTIDENGNYSTLGVGESTIIAYMTENEDINSELNIKIEQEIIDNEYVIDIFPDKFYVLQDNSLQYKCSLFLNGEETAETFEFYDITQNVPRDKYSIKIIDGNNFIVTNYGMYMNSPLIIKCVSGEHIKNIEIELRGLY